MLFKWQIWPVLPLSSLNPPGWEFHDIRVCNLIPSLFKSSLFSPGTALLISSYWNLRVYIYFFAFNSSPLFCLIKSNQVFWPHLSPETALIKVRNNLPLLKLFFSSPPWFLSKIWHHWSILFKHCYNLVFSYQILLLFFQLQWMLFLSFVCLFACFASLFPSASGNFSTQFL